MDHNGHSVRFPTSKNQKADKLVSNIKVFFYVRIRNFDDFLENENGVLFT